MDLLEAAREDSMSCKFGATLPKDPSCTLLSSWTTTDPSTFLIRGNNYLEDHQKVPFCSSIYFGICTTLHVETNFYIDFKLVFPFYGLMKEIQDGYIKVGPYIQGCHDDDDIIIRDLLQLSVHLCHIRCLIFLNRFRFSFFHIVLTQK